MNNQLINLTRRADTPVTMTHKTRLFTTIFLLVSCLGCSLKLVTSVSVSEQRNGDRTSQRELDEVPHGQLKEVTGSRRISYKRVVAYKEELTHVTPHKFYLKAEILYDHDERSEAKLIHMMVRNGKILKYLPKNMSIDDEISVTKLEKKGYTPRSSMELIFPSKTYSGREI